MAKPPFSRYRKVGNLIFTSGQVHLTDEGILLKGSIEEKTHQVMQNLKAVLAEAGVGFGEVVKATIYITDLSLYERVNEVYIGYFDNQVPAREMVGVKELPLGAELEISMVAEVK